MGVQALTLDKAKWLLALLVLVASFTILADRATSASATPIKLGVYYCPSSPAYTACSPTSGAALDGYKNELGRYPDIAMNYRSLDEPLLSAEEIAAQEARQVEPMITVEPYVGGYGNGVSMADIAKGSYDNYINAEAKVAKSYNGEVLIRFAHEMNGSWYDWGAGNGSTAQDYVNAWRHYVSVFRQDGAANVKFVWAPNVNGGSYPFTSYFPGDSWVDYVALDGYNWGHSGSNSWQSFAQAFGSSYEAITQLSSKPVMITETGSSEIGGDKAAWIHEAFLHEIPKQFPRIVAVTWFDRDFSAAGEQDWRLSSSSASLAAYRQVVSNSLYGGPDPAPSEAEPAPESGGATPTRGGKRRATVTALRVQLPTREGFGNLAAPTVKVLRTRVVYRLSRPAPVQITIETMRRPTTVATVMVSGSRRSGAIRLSKLVRGRALKRGAYRVVARTIDDGEAQSSTRHARLSVL